MKRIEIAPGAYVTQVPGEKFKRGKIALNLVAESRRETATALALLPHVLDRRCAAIPDALELSRRLFALYGAELTSESYTAGANRVVTLGLSGLKNEYALGGEDLAAEYLELLCALVFAPKLSGGVFESQDVEIEKEKQADFLRSEMNNKRVYCLRQARRKLYAASPLGIESSGYLEDMEGLTPKGLYDVYRQLLQTAHIEVQVCGIDAEKVASTIAEKLRPLQRSPQPPASAPPLPVAAKMESYSEAMDTTQGKLCLMFTSGQQPGAQVDAVMRLASALYGGLPTSRLFTNVREKQSLCYYCASSHGLYGGTLTVDSGVDHKNAGKAATAILHELETMQKQPVSADELANAKLYMRGAYSSAKDSPDALVNWALNEWLRGTNRSLDEVVSQIEAVDAEAVRAALAAFTPAVEYLITAKEGA